MHRIFNFLANSHLLLALEALALTRLSSLIFDFSVSLSLYGLLATATYSVYNLNVFYLSPQNYRYHFLQKKLSLFKISVFASTFLCLSFAFFQSLQTLFILTHLAFISIFYTLSLGKYPALRFIPYFKIILIAYVWTFSTALLPYLAQCDMLSTPKTQTVLDLLGYSTALFCFMLSITIPFDIRDREIDAQSSVKTLATYFNADQARLIAVLLLLAFCGLHLYLKLPYMSLTALLTTATALILYYLQEEKSTANYYHTLDGLMLMVWLLGELFFQLNYNFEVHSK